MLFNSIDFAFFFPIVFILHWLFSQKLKSRNIFILISSYIFYGWWDWRFLFLIILSSLIDFYVGRKLGREDNKRKRKNLLLLSLIFNLGFLIYFKYFNFFVDSFVDAFTLFGKELEVTTLNIILPVGISFYTFQTLSYSIDVYKRKLVPTNDIISFFTFVAFFPQLVAGPIERASHLLRCVGIDIFRHSKDELSVILEVESAKLASLENYKIMLHALPIDSNIKYLSKTAISNKRSFEIWDFNPKIKEINEKTYLVKNVDTDINELKFGCLQR